MSPENLFFTSDTHFGHKRMLEYRYYGQYKFADVDSMNEMLIEQWNRTVPPGAVVFHLGDFSFCNAGATLRILWQLNGQIYLIEGNHDRGLNARVRGTFVWAKPYHELTVEDEDGKQKIVMCHFPFRSWNQMHYGSWNLHGHSHGNLPPQGKQLDVGVDTRALLRPYSYAEVKAYLNQRSIAVVDHHAPKEEHADSTESSVDCR